MKKLAPRIFSLFLLLVLLVASTSLARAAAPVTQAVLFYSPSCSHCHKVIEEVLPPLREQYKDQLEIVMIDVTSEQGQALYQSAITAFDIPDDRLGVPTLIIGETVLVGSSEIPERLAALIDYGLKNGGTALPEIPGLQEAIAGVEDQPGAIEQPGAEAQPQAAAQPSSQQGGANQASPDSIPVNSQPEASSAQPEQSDAPEFILKFQRDPVANSISVIVLLGMIVSVIIIGVKFVNGSTDGMEKWPARNTIPLLAVLGLGVAGYLSFVETTQTQAVCGPVGNCNAVQDSIYASILGIPVGIIGLLGYLVILGAWGLQYFGPPTYRRLMALAVWLMAWLGVLFSIYLTFLEPFVIGASCMWCLSSAILMTLVLWMATPAALAAMQSPGEDLV